MAFLALTASAQGQSRPAVPAPSASAPAAQSQPASKPDLSPVVAAGSRSALDVAYVSGGHEQQRLDLYAPATAKAAPVVIFVHGGEWTKGDKREVSHKPKLLNEHGIIFISVNYRLSGVAKHPAQVEDVAAAIRWTRDHVAEWGGDPQEIVLMGHSAGCHLVSLVALDPRPLAKYGMKPADLKGVVSWSGGAFDLPEKVRAGGMYADYIRINFGEDERAWRDASPMAHVGDSKLMPQFLFASAQQGNPASREASEKMVALIRAAGGKAEAALLEGRTHSTANSEVGRPGDKTGEMLVEFVRAVTKSGEAGDK